jgi:hypothetical protein
VISLGQLSLEFKPATPASGDQRWLGTALRQACLLSAAGRECRCAALTVGSRDSSARVTTAPDSLIVNNHPMIMLLLLLPFAAGWLISVAR